MILLDASVWIDHIRHADKDVAALLDSGRILCHPFVLGEVGLGQFRSRNAVLAELRKLPAAEVASDGEVMDFVERFRLFGCGIGYLDAHLLAAVLLTAGARLWTRDKRLKTAAARLNLAAEGLN